MERNIQVSLSSLMRCAPTVMPGKKDEAENRLKSVIARGEKVKAWKEEDPEADPDWWYVIAMGMAEEFDSLGE